MSQQFNSPGMSFKAQPLSQSEIDEYSIYNEFVQRIGVDRFQEDRTLSQERQRREQILHSVQKSQPAPAELQPVVFANKYMLKPIDQSNEANTSANNGIEQRFPEAPYQGKNIPPPRPIRFMGQKEDSDDECDCNREPLTDSELNDPRRYIKERQRQEHEYICQQNRYRSRSQKKEVIYRDEYQPHKYEKLIENEDRESYQLYSQNVGTVSEMTSDNTKKKRQVSFNFDKPPKRPDHPVNMSYGTDVAPQQTIIKPYIPNQIRKHSLQKQYEELVEVAERSAGPQYTPEQIQRSTSNERPRRVLSNEPQRVTSSERLKYQRMNELQAAPLNLEPQVLALDQDESRELNLALAPKQSNSSFIKSLKNVKSKISSFQNKEQKQSSYRKYQVSTTSQQQTPLRKPRTQYPSHHQKDNIITKTQFSQSHNLKIKNARISNDRPQKIAPDHFEQLQRQKELELLELKLQKRRENAKRRKHQRMNDSRLSQSSKKSLRSKRSQRSVRSLSSRSNLNLRRRGLSANSNNSFRSDFVSRPRESNSQPQMFRIQARNNTRKEEDERSDISNQRLAKEKKLKAYRTSIGSSTLKKMRVVSRNVGKQSMTGNTTRSQVSMIRKRSTSKLRSKSAKKNKAYLQKHSRVKKPPLRSKKLKKKKSKSNSSFSRRLDNTKHETNNSINHSNYDKVEENERPLESYKKFIKIPAPFEETFKSVGQQLQDESNIYSPIGRNQVEHFNSRNDESDEFEKYRKALKNQSNSRSKSRRRLYLELIKKFEQEEREHKRKKRSKSKSQKNIKSPLNMKRESRSRSKSNNIINIKAKGSILKDTSRLDERSGTFSKATFGGHSLNSQREKRNSMEFKDDFKETLTFPITGANSTLDPVQVKEIYGQLKQKSTQLNSLLDQLSQIVQV